MSNCKVQLPFSFFATIVVLVLTSGSLVKAQVSSDISPKINSPYSRLGLGDFVPAQNAAGMGMGRQGVAFQDQFYANFINPASLAYLRVTSLDVSLYGKFSHWKDGDLTDNIWSGNLVNVSLAFPIFNPINEALEQRQGDRLFHWGMGFALQPYTTVGYNLQLVEADPEGGTSNSSILKGTGGTYKIAWANGLRWGDFAVGIEAAYRFGKITNSRRILLDSLVRPWATEFVDEYSINGFSWNAGLEYTRTLSEGDALSATIDGDRRLTFGLYGHTANSFNTNASQLVFRDNSSTSPSRDTVSNFEEVRGSGQLPAEFGLGFQYDHIGKIKFGAEFSLGQWSGYENEAAPQDLTNNWRIAGGVEWIPAGSLGNRYFSKVRYRTGFFYGTDPRTLDGTQISEYGLTFGAGFPIVFTRQTTSFVNLAVEAGRFGVPNELIENYIQLKIGFALNDNTWFYKRKFN